MELKKDLPGDVYRYFEGGGEMGELTRSFDWSTHPLGPMEGWPKSLLTTLGIILHSAFPMFLFWGKDLICFYNDAYRPSLGMNGKHPAVGKKGKEVWPEIWDFIGPLIEKVLTSGEHAWFEDQLLPIYRNGRMEDVYWTFSYSPAYTDDGRINGVFVTCTETTEKLHVNERLRRSEEYLRNTILKAPVAMCILKGKDQVVEIANDKMIELWGTTEKNVLGKPLFEGLPEVRNQGFEQLLDDVFTTGKTYTAQAAPVSLPRNRKLEIAYVNFIYEAYRESGGDIVGVMAVALDVTDQVIARKSVEESEQRVRSLVESAPFPIGVYVGREMRIELLNQAIIDVWGKGGDLIGKLYREVLPELHNQAIYDQLDRVYTTGTPFHARNQRVDLIVDGKLKPYFFNYSFTPLFDTAGEVYGVMNTAADVTDLVLVKERIEQSEQNFRNMILQAPVAMCLMVGPNHVIEIANQYILDLWGKTASEVLGKPVFDVFKLIKGQGLEQLLDRVYQTGEMYKGTEHLVNLVRNGRVQAVYQNFTYQPYKDGSGKTLGIIATTLDVTAQVVARQKIEEVVEERTRELAAANASLQQSNAELAQFAYIASHDLQEPVRKVSTFSQLLEANLGTIDERSQNYINKIKVSSSRMLTLIRDVLAYSEFSRANEDFRKVDLQQVVEEIKTDYELLIQQKNASIQYGSLPHIEAIPLHMSQLFGNLISNALKFTRPGDPPEIGITASVLSSEEKKEFPVLSREAVYYKIELKDNGIGFQQENSSQIFNIFQRLHGRKEFEGTGIGLALCQKIVQNHNGEIYARSIPGKGSTFAVILPEKQVRA